LETPHFGGTRKEFLNLLSTLSVDGLKMTFDVGHADIVCQPADYIRGMVNKVVHIHIHDNDGRYDQHAPIGSGTVNFDSLFKVLTCEEYDGSITVERIVDRNIMDDIDKVRYYISRNQKNFGK